MKRQILATGTIVLVILAGGCSRNVERIAPYESEEAGRVAGSIRNNYETRFFELEQNSQAHFAVRIFRATGASPNLDAVTIDVARWAKDLEQKLDSLSVDGYIEREGRIAHAGKREITPVMRARKRMFASHQDMLIHRRILYVAHKLRDFGLHEGEFRDDYEAARRHLKGVDFADFLLDSEVIRTYAAQTSNLVYWLKRVEVVDLEEAYTQAFREVFMTVDDAELSGADYQNKLYGLTHFIIADSHYYQRMVSHDKHRWILDYFDRHILEILSWSKPDIVAEIALCFKLCGLADHQVVEMAREYLVNSFDPALGFIPSKPGSGDFNISEHRNAVAYLVLSDWDHLNEGPVLDAAAVRALIPVDIVPPVDPAAVPVGGDPVPELSPFDWAMTAFMEANGIGAGLLGVMKDGEMIYERSYGWQDEEHTTPLAPDAMMRIASVTKPFTAAAVRRMVESGIVSLDDHVFDLGQEGGGLLAYRPFPGLGDDRLRDITLGHLLEHTAGWDADVAGDHTFRELEIARAMDVSSPPGRIDIARWIMGQPLQSSPGEKVIYSNEGYFFLGLIIEQVTGRDYMEYLRSAVLAPAGIVDHEVTLGRTLRGDRNDREPWYESRRACRSVFEPMTRVDCAYGGWSVENHVSTGRLVVTTRALLSFLDTYYVIGPRIGLERREDWGGNWKLSHTGGFAGTSALARQRGDGIHYVVIFNKHAPAPADYASAIRELLDRVVEEKIVRWPVPPRQASDLSTHLPGELACFFRHLE